MTWKTPLPLLTLQCSFETDSRINCSFTDGPGWHYQTYEHTRTMTLIIQIQTVTRGVIFSYQLLIKEMEHVSTTYFFSSLLSDSLYRSPQWISSSILHCLIGPNLYQFSHHIKTLSPICPVYSLSFQFICTYFSLWWTGDLSGVYAASRPMTTGDGRQYSWIANH